MFRRSIVSIEPPDATRRRSADAPNRYVHALRQLNDGALGVLVLVVALLFLRVGFDRPALAPDQLAISAELS